jgi:hypothetical protein
MTAKDGGSGRSGSIRNFRGLPPDATTVDVVFTPDPQAVETRSDWSEIWGDEIVIRDVPIVGRLTGGDAVRASLGISAVHLGRTDGRRATPARIQYMRSGHTPRDMSMQIIVRVGEFEREIGTLTFEGNGTRYGGMGEPLEDFPEETTTADVILQPLPTGRADDDQWTEPIVYRNVPVIRDGEQPR